MTKRWSSVRSDLVTTKRAASKSARFTGKIEIERQLESWYCDQCHIEVYGLRCEICGKTKRERRLGDMSAQVERTTLSGRPPKDLKGAAPDMTLDERGMHRDYWVLSEAERAKGFVRPVRSSYQHVGAPGPSHPLRDLTEEERSRFSRFGYVKFEAYPGNDSVVTGRFWTAADLDRIGKGCGVVTRMSEAIAETYARDPRFYGSTYCAGCQTHLPVGPNGEFVWDGTDERVGT